MCQHDFQGRRLFQHRNLYRWNLLGRNPRVEDSWFEDQCCGYLAELRRLWKGIGP
jgi:hypothetical protein